MKPPLIRQLTLKNFLSFGPEGVTLDLQPLNVLIGPNASGKSNVLEALGLLGAAPRDLQRVVRGGGGVAEFIWKDDADEHHAVLNVGLHYPHVVQGAELRHRIEFGALGSQLELVSEKILLCEANLVGLPELIVNREAGRSLLRATVRPGMRDKSQPGDLNAGQSVLSQRRDPERYPEITYLAERFEQIVLYQEWSLGRRTPVRKPQPTDLPPDFLLPDASNLSLVLNDLTQTSAGREDLTGYLRAFYEKARFISIKVHGGTAQLFIEEEGGRLIPATRLSDGTLRYLCLLAILCHPNPPPVIGIEEPELGLHPDIMPTIAELLRKASERTQLFVTTHSDALVSALSDTPESILVCESTPDGTAIERLDAERLSAWLKDYTLGEIWRMGEIGGNRW